MSRMIKLAQVLGEARLSAVLLETGGQSVYSEDRPETKKMLDYVIKESEKSISQSGPPDELDGCYVKDYSWLSLYPEIYRSIDRTLNGIDLNEKEGAIAYIISGVRNYGIHNHYGESIGNSSWCSRKMYRMLSVNIKNYFEKPLKALSPVREYASNRLDSNTGSVEQNCEALKVKINSIVEKAGRLGVNISLEDLNMNELSCGQGISEENKVEIYEKALSVIFNKINQNPAEYISGNEEHFKAMVENYSTAFKLSGFVMNSIDLVFLCIKTYSFYKLLASAMSGNIPAMLIQAGVIAGSTTAQREIKAFTDCISPKIDSLFFSNLNLKRSLALLSAYTIVGSDMPKGKTIRVAGRLIDPSSREEFEREKRNFSRIILEDILKDPSPYYDCNNDFPILSEVAATIMGVRS